MKRIYILEGPDGGGKSTLGLELSTRLGVQVTNHGPYKGEAQIWKHYFDSMIPAYSGERDVILDRCWLAEPIYGEVYREGVNRMEPWQLRILEYVARECRAVIIWCLPPVEKCIQAFNSRRKDEMLDNEGQLRSVYNHYALAADQMLDRGRFISLIYDYTDQDSKSSLEEVTT